ncbi:MAG: hypothetical protein V7676_17500 [Parasphingorhabdus sp.]|uniref:hypothetical protein n=1 Tax=Parasphingorhabdus sp. TaxID=2709688 RepID=UPI0030016AD7
MIETTPLLVLAELPENFDLDDLNLPENLEHILKIRKIGNETANLREVMLDGMSFLLRTHDIEETQGWIESISPNFVGFTPPEIFLSSIGLSLGESIADTLHFGKINRALMLLGQYIGDAIEAVAFAWTHADNLIGAEYFGEALDQYMTHGTFPASVQIAFKADGPGKFKTHGLSYFADQEIELVTPTDYPEKQAIEAMIRIVHDIGTNGKFDGKLSTQGKRLGEHPAFVSGNDARILQFSLLL